MGQEWSEEIPAISILFLFPKNCPQKVSDSLGAFYLYNFLFLEYGFLYNAIN